MSRKGRVVITGIGPFSSIGFGKEQTWQSLIKGKTGLTKEDYFVNGEKVGSYYQHKITGFDINTFGIDKDMLEDIRNWKGQGEALDLFYLMAGVKLALDDSGLEYTSKDNNSRVGLVLTHEHPGSDQFYEDIINESYELSQQNKSKRDYFNTISARFLKRGYELQTFMFLFHIAKTFNIHGYSLFLNNACASGLYAIEAASDIIKSGKCDKVIVAAADHGSMFKYLWFKEMGMYPKDGKIKPFDKNRDGFIAGDGGAGIVLEHLDSALKRKAHIYAEYIGGGFSLEGWKVTIPDMSNTSYEIAILDAIRTSKIRKEKIDLIMPHGVGTKVTDAYEAKAIEAIFGKNPKKPLISAVKPYIGHNLGGTALLETTILLMTLENNVVLPTLNNIEVDTSLSINLVKKKKMTKLRTVMKTACGFAGYNAACIFRKIREARL
ncbi:MAG: hypothetical protein HZB61_09785 [Nitrospirae bacterium]|nr:hypothetical protein [Nitrospirota bacterium]